MANLSKITRALPIIGLLIFVYILSRIDLGHVAESFKEINIFYFLTAVLLSMPALFVKTEKWLKLVKPFASFGIFDGMKAMLIGLFIGLVTPARIGDFTRAFYLKQGSSANTGESLATVVFDRIVDIVALFSLALIGLLWLANFYSMGTLLWLVAVAFTFFASMVFAFLNENFTKKMLKPLYNILVPEKYKGKLSAGFYDFYRAASVLRSEKKRLFFVGVLSMIGLFLNFMQYYFLALALNLSISFMFIAMIMPLAMLVEILPISFSGIGTRDATLILFLGFAGIASFSAVSLSISILVLNYILAAFGYVLWIRNPIRL